MDPQLLPMVYVAYRTSLSEGTEVFHANLGERWRAGDTEVVEATKTWASYAEEGRDWLIRRDYRRLDFLINANFDLRARIYPIDRGILEIMHTARGVGATSKFAGSGGAIVGTCRDEEMLQRLVAAMARIDVVVIRPKIVQSAAARTPLGVVVPDAPVRLLAAV